MLQTSRVAAIVSIVFLALAVSSRWPYGFYTLLRIVVCGSAIYLACYAHLLRKHLWVWVAGAVGVLFNPVFPIYMRRAQWRWFDIVALVVFLISLGVVRPKSSNTGRSALLGEANNLEVLLDEIAGQGWICPQPRRWEELYELLPGRRRVGLGWEPPLPLILAAWWDTPHLAKKQRFVEHLEWAQKHGALDTIVAFLRNLRKQDWYFGIGEPQPYNSRESNRDNQL